RDIARHPEIHHHRRTSHLELGFCPVPRHHLPPQSGCALHGQGGIIPPAAWTVFLLVWRDSRRPQQIHRTGGSNGGGVQPFGETHPRHRPRGDAASCH